MTQPALVLGSAQSVDLIRGPRAQAAGYEVCQRRSGGGLVVVEPDSSRWVDLLIPRHHAQWDDDVGRAFEWVGRTWERSLRSLGLGNVQMHTGPLLDRDLGRVVCFAGTGPGEVLVDGRKVVGLSQRRTRDGARFQALIVNAWNPAPIRQFLDSDALPPELDARLESLPVGVPLDLDHAVDAFIAELPRGELEG